MPYKIYKKLNENGDIEELPLDGGGVDLSEEQISFIKNEYLKSLNELHLENISRRISSGIFYSLTDETITISGTKTTEGTFIQSLGYCECKANTQYTSKVFNDPSLDTAYIAVDVVDSSKQWIATYFPTPSVSFTTPSNAAFFQIRVVVESTEKVNKVFPVLIKEGTEIPEEFSKFYGDILHQVDLDNHNDNTTTAHGSLLKFIDNQKEIVYKNASESVNELKLLNTKPITQNGVTWYVKDNCLYSQGAPGNKASITLTLDEPFSIPYTNPLVYTGKVFGYTSGIYSSVLMDTNDPRPTVVYYFPNNGDTFSTQGYSVSSLYISNLKPSTTGDEWKVLKFSLVKGTQPEEFPEVHWNEITHGDDLIDYAKKSEIPTDLSQLSEDTTHRVVTDTEKETWNNKANVSDIPTNNNQLTNGAGFINKDVNNLTNYTLATNTASSIEMSIDNSTYVVSLKLKNADGTQLGETQTIDLPLESVVVNGDYDSNTKEVVLTLDNGNEIRFSVADLVSGLATTSDLNNYLPLAGGTITPNKTGNFNEGIYIEDASNGWSTLGLGSKDKKDLIGITHNKEQGKATISRKVSDVQFDINVPAKNGTIALTSDIPTQQEKEFLTEEFENGKNLFNADDPIILNTYITNAGIRGYDAGSTTIIVKIKPNTDYVVSKKLSNPVSANRLAIGTTKTYPTYNMALSTIKLSHEGTETTELTIKSSDDDNYLVAYIHSNLDNITLKEMLNSVQIEEGVVATSHQNYNANKHISNNEAEFLTNEYNKTVNLLDIPEKSSTTTNGIEYSISKGVITINGTTNIDFGLNIPINTIPSGTYSYNDFRNTSKDILTGITDSNYYYIIYGQNENDGRQTITTSSNGVFFRLWFSSNTTFINFKISPMLITGTTIPSTHHEYNSSSHITNEQADLLKSELGKSLTIELKDITLTIGVYLYSNGEFVSTNNYITTKDLIPIMPNQSILINFSSSISTSKDNQDSGFIFFGKNKEFLGVSKTLNNTIAPANAYYYIFNINYSQAIDNIDIIGELVASGLNEIVHEKDITPVLLWENANANADMVENTQLLSETCSNYSRIRVLYKRQTGSNQYLFAEGLPNEYLNCAAHTGGTEGVILMYRGIQFNDTNVTFLNAYFAGGSNSEYQDNSRVIPIRIWGLKV